MTQAHQQIMDEIAVLPVEKLEQIITFIKFIKHQNVEEPIVDDYNFDYMQIDTQKYKFDRAEANAR